MENLFNGIYKNKKVLITGHTGFKGSWLTLWLTKLGANVIGYSKDIPTTPNHFELLNPEIISITGDVLDKEKILQVLSEHKPDIIFHMAAQPLVRKSYRDPVETFETNIIGTINVLEAARKVGTIEAIVNITSDKGYKNNEDGRAYSEDDPMGGNDPYSASKGAAELVSQSYRTSFFHHNKYGKDHSTLIANVRAGNVIGGGDWAEDRLIPDIIKAAERGETVIIRRPRAVRPWQHVLEPLSGYLLLGSHLLKGKKEYADDWNFGPGEDATITVGDVLKQAKKYWDTIAFEIQEDPHAVHEATLLRLNTAKARTKLDWKSVWNADKTFQKTIEWYKNYYVHEKIVSEQDLQEYIEEMKKQYYKK
ncbi:MAG: CDP-glucose 4,6-dehydratase [bacterium]|nr:CDP-glucose 4,6-dehydratase [bacterium]